MCEDNRYSPGRKGIPGGDLSCPIYRRLRFVSALEFSEVPGIFGFLRLERYLSERIGRPVDLVEKSALKPRIGRRVAKEVLYV